MNRLDFGSPKCRQCRLHQDMKSWRECGPVLDIRADVVIPNLIKKCIFPNEFGMACPDQTPDQRRTRDSFSAAVLREQKRRLRTVGGDRSWQSSGEGSGRQRRQTAAPRRHARRCTLAVQSIFKHLSGNTNRHVRRRVVVIFF
jgi:hypothetical protein